MKGNDVYDVKETKESLHIIKKKYNQTKLDGSFQRWGGVERGSGWTKKAAEQYMESVFAGKVFNKIMNAEVESCYRCAVDIRDKESETYFKALLDEGHKYVSIDGNNSASTFNAYINNEFAVYTDLDPTTRGKGKKKKYFRDLSESEQEDLLYTEKLTYYTFRKIGIIEMCELFRRENTSTHLNKQEYRQARWSPMAKFVRDTANDPQNRSKTTTSLVAGVMKDVALIAKDIKLVKRHRMSPGLVQVLFDLVAYINSHKKEIKIDNHKQFMTWFLETDQAFRQISLKVLEEDQHERSYIYWLRVYTQRTPFLKSLNLFKRAITRDLVALLEDGTMASVRTSSDVFSTSQRLKIFYLQEGQLRTGEEVSILDLYTGKLEADHMISVKDGGSTTIDNGELMTVYDNRQKGAASNQPHFNHQKGQ